jgi:hypothetical protein
MLSGTSDPYNGNLSDQMRDCEDSWHRGNMRDTDTAANTGRVA